jgi:hypothetical protein
MAWVLKSCRAGGACEKVITSMHLQPGGLTGGHELLCREPGMEEVGGCCEQVEGDYAPCPSPPTLTITITTLSPCAIKVMEGIPPHQLRILLQL